METNLVGVQVLRRLSHRPQTLEAEPRNELLRCRVSFLTRPSGPGSRTTSRCRREPAKWLAREPVGDLLAQRIAEEKEETLKL